MLDAITPARIAEYRNELLATPKQRGGGKRSGADVNRTIAALSSAMTHAVKELGWIERNPCERVTKQKEAGGRIRFLSDEELPVLLRRGARIGASRPTACCVAGADDRRTQGRDSWSALVTNRLQAPSYHPAPWRDQEQRRPRPAVVW